VIVDVTILGEGDLTHLAIAGRGPDVVSRLRRRREWRTENGHPANPESDQE
jgi:hypothetical protein